MEKNFEEEGKKSTFRLVHYRVDIGSQSLIYYLWSPSFVCSWFKTASTSTHIAAGDEERLDVNSRHRRGRCNHSAY
eukprot:scaffold2525_cov110-Alexandrium_tamarense.AAC.1